MNNLTYRISSKIRSDSRFVEYRAMQENGKSVILKTPKSSYPSAQTLNKLKEEFSILSDVEGPNIVRGYALDEFDNKLALIMEDIQGTTLSNFNKNHPVDLGGFFRIAIPLVESIKTLHHKRIIHKNINPFNVILNPAGHTPKLIGFNLATSLPREAIQANQHETLDTQLSYISPEQTARMNRAVDHRSDLYSLGAVFFEMLTGRPPFITEDPMEMIHNHIARQPTPPHELDTKIPAIISALVMRLLAKNADDRYQSAAGLLYDLKSLSDILNKELPLNDFKLGGRDVHDQFRIPEKLYGRQAELEELVKTFERVKNGREEVVLIAGYSGVGKSRLVEELKKSIAHQKGYFISGKIDQFKRDIPLSSLIAAFRELIRQILSENESRMLHWKENILNAIGSNGKIINDVIPEMEMLIGEQPPVPELPPAESNNRFNRIFTNLIKVFANKEQPLCIFLDDLQWFDSATRQWIETQLIGDELSHFMLIGAYRDNEVNPSHPLMLMFDRLKKSGVIINGIQLKSLNQEMLNQLVADVLQAKPEACGDLSDLIFNKTNGNPFFSKQCLHSLNENDAIYFEPENYAWSYDIAKSKEASISDNVVDLMSMQIEKLPIGTKEMLKVAACLGNEFNSDLLQLVSNSPPDLVAEQLSIAVQKGLILPNYKWNDTEVNAFKFLHDRVQQAALDISDQEEKMQIRLKAGKILLKDLDISETEEEIFVLADHLNYSKTLISDPGEIGQLININYAASKRAKNSNAYEPALNYIKIAMRFLPPTETHHTSKLHSDLSLQRAECEHLCGNNDLAEHFFNLATEQAETTLDKGSVYIRKIHFYSNLRKFEEAYQTGRQAVSEFGVNLPAKFFPPQFVKDLVVNRLLTLGKKISDLADIREMKDADKRMAILLMATFARAAYQIKPELCIAVCAKMVNLCLRYGNTDGGFIGYLAFGPIFIGSILKFRKAGFQLGQLSLALVEKYKSLSYKAETHFVVGYFSIPWQKGAIEMERYWQIAYDAGMETGDFFHTSCACCATIQSYLMRGVSFDEIMNASDRYLEFLKVIDDQEAILTIMSVRQTIKNLKGETITTESISSHDFNEVEGVAAYEKFNARHFAHYYFINKMMVLYLRGSYREAYDMALLSDGYLNDSPGMLHTAEHYFFKALIICKLYAQANWKNRLRWRSQLNSYRAKFRKYSHGCADTFVHKYQLLEAEISRIRGKYPKAEKYYNLAIESAVENKYMNIQGLTYLLLADFHSEQNRQSLVGYYLKKAKKSYTALGASAFADSIEITHADYTSDQSASGKPHLYDIDGAETTGAQGLNTLDLDTVLKSSEAISKEIRLKDLISALMKIMVENAGADRIVLLLEDEGRLQIQGDYISSKNRLEVLTNTPLDSYQKISGLVVNFVARTKETIILEDASTTGDFTHDTYFQSHHTHSVLCTPLVQQGKLVGIIYLENNLVQGAFTQERVELLNILSGQMAISIENAQHYEHLEKKVQLRTKELNEEKNKSDELLLNILPPETAEELKRTGTAQARNFELVTVLFTDMKNFTAFTEQMTAQELVNEMNYCYTAFDQIIARHGIEKIKTIGDSYMCAGGIPVEKASNPKDTVLAALDIRNFMEKEKKKRAKQGKQYFDIRIGIHSGPVVAGIVGIKKFAYDIWGDTVNIASRMESSGQAGKINISGSTYELVKEEIKCLHRGKIEAKNKGKIDMYFVDQ